MAVKTTTQGKANATLARLNTIRRKLSSTDRRRLDRMLKRKARGKGLSKLMTVRLAKMIEKVA